MKANIEETRRYYQSLPAEALCDCAYCRNYYLQIRGKYPRVSAYLDSMGVDIAKPFETSPLEPDENQMLEYCACQYIVFGRCSDDYRHQIDGVELRLAHSLPSAGIPQEHIVLERAPVKLPVILPL